MWQSLFYVALGTDDGAQRDCPGVVVHCFVQTRQGDVCLNNGCWTCVCGGVCGRDGPAGSPRDCPAGPLNLCCRFRALGVVPSVFVLSISCIFFAVGFLQSFSCSRLLAVGLLLSVSCCRFFAVGFVPSVSCCRLPPVGFVFRPPIC